MQDMMKVGTYVKKGEFALKTVPVPQIGAEDVLVKVARAGVCAAEVYYYKQGGEPWVHPGSIVGHELVGTICEVGESLREEFRVGQRVFVEPVKGSPAETNGIIGAFAEYVAVRKAKMGYNVFLLPDTLPFKEAVVIEPFCVALHGVVRAEVKPEDHVVIMGAGPIGLMALAGMLEMGYQNVVITDIRQEAIDMVRKFGGEAINTKEQDLKQALIDRFGAVENNLHRIVPDVDAYINYTGAPGMMQQIMPMAKNYTKYVLVAGEPNGDVGGLFMDMLCLNSEIRGSYTYTTEVINQAIRILAPGGTIVPRVVTHEFPLEEFEEAIHCSALRSDSFKVTLNISDF